MHARASPSLLKVGASTPVKATASLLMWSVISSELDSLQHGGSRSVGKPVWKRGEEVCIYLCWWGMIPTLICLQTSSWTALRAAEAIRSLCQPQRVEPDVWPAPVEKSKTLVHPEERQQVQPKTGKLLDLLTFYYTVNDWQVNPKHIYTIYYVV